MRDDGCGSLDWNPPGSPIAGGRGWSSPIDDNGAGADGGAPTDLGHGSKEEQLGIESSSSCDLCASGSGGQKWKSVILDSY
jgi:hypothetical protein